MLAATNVRHTNQERLSLDVQKAQAVTQVAKLTVGSLFAGVGGIELGLERTDGFRTVWQVERDLFATRVLERHWPCVRRWGDVRNCQPDPSDEWRCDLVCGGDPCPKHGNARCGQPTRHPDLSGYFLALVGRLCPRWVVRENVPAPTTAHFEAALDALGYGAVVVRIDAAALTGQARIRDFVIGCYHADRRMLRETFSECEDDPGFSQTRLALAQKVACLTTNRTRHNTDDNNIWEPKRVLRILDSQEREALAGFPTGWTAGFSSTARARMLGNAVVPAVAEFIGHRILAAEKAKGGG